MSPDLVLGDVISSKKTIALVAHPSGALARGVELETLSSDSSLVDGNEGCYVSKTIVLRDSSVQSVRICGMCSV